MHILVVNDDGPPSNASSPYVHSLVSKLQDAGHVVSVVLPHTQRSWIGKAHFVGQLIKPTYFRPGPLQLSPSDTTLNNTGETSNRPLPSGSDVEEWVLIDSTPASCVQIGLYHFFQDRGKVDLVVSGPNYGRNTTAVFSLSSGTIGGAMEAAVCGVRSIALSFAFFDRNHDPEIIAGATNVSVKVIEKLWQNWGNGVQLYSVNVPLVENVAQKKIVWTKMLQNAWTSGSAFQAVDVPAEGNEGADAAEVEIRQQEAEGTQKGREAPQESSGSTQHLRYTHQHFKWAPTMKDVYESVERNGPGSDGWAVKEGMVSVTPLRANFMHVEGFEGDFKL